MMTDPIADMLTRIRNAQAARKSHVEVASSKLKKAIAEILSSENYLGKIEEKNSKPRLLSIELKYNGRKPIISEIKRESKPGHRMYCAADELPKVLNDFGIAIISTSQGLMTNKKARKLGIGGEVICSVY